MSSRLCFCVWAVAGWPPGSALQLRLGMPSVCEEQQVTVVELAHPYVRAFTDIVKLWKQGCTGSSWCVSYERSKEEVCEAGWWLLASQEKRPQNETCLATTVILDFSASRTVLFSIFSFLWICPVAFPCYPQAHLFSEDGEKPFGQDVNECTIDNGGCQDRCCNTVGCYYCKCQADQKLKEDGKGCEDVDECAVVNGGCQQRCINTLGTFHWECDTGWRLHADECTCIKMDPCTGGNGCVHICQSENGTARCACHAGYQLSEDKNICEGIELEIVNSCEKNNGGCSHHHEHAIGTPRCSCNHGHQLDSDEKMCIDLDECENGEACCDQLCISYLGGYECRCQEGFQISSDGCGCDALDDDELEEEEEE
ncbi:PREDICTED: EGF-like and EMI domain-containing protein 1 isoform X2 [Cercocebus atys]|uniref:EGF-like and EMI domain-containing protein 1 isoform X2 n=1 Tax=Cercocebus atys TaxID=9531 RepID=UPI0005F48C26|nr:PREDICTED: EGF-like and EMI domain-containing protein 1 isoform X2 [Cercocebus atys]